MQRTNCQHCGTVFSGKTNMARRKFCGKDCSRAYIRAQGPARFWAKVHKTPSCWLYTGFTKWDGYGWLARSEGDAKVRYMTAHRYAWILTHGKPPEGMHILHECDVPACCNPAHLRLGTHRDNMDDQKAKLRHVHGARNPNCVLTAEIAEEIRRLYRRPAYKVTNAKELAQKFNTTIGRIHSIARGDSWKITTPAAPLHPGRVRPRRQS